MPNRLMQTPLSRDAALVGRVSRLLRDAQDLRAQDRCAASPVLARAARLIHPESEVADRPVVPGGLAPWQTRRVATLIEARPGASLPLCRLAAEVRLSRGHFARAFKRSFGVTPHAYVTERRIARAKALMLAAETPLSTIALECGLSDQAHFSRLFRRLTGETPLAWRRRHGAGPAA